ncbi:hypothetical protein H4R33_000800 [Dimargaris cristalligena]|nr:hypothetical protein H4R33_000800 [Dimargaris cristalligena]
MPPLPPSTVLSDPFEGETALPSRLHRRNRYRAHPPNFTDLATRYPEFAQRISSSGRATIDFQDPLSVSLDYIHVIEDLVVARQNVANNGLSSKIQVLENPDPTTVLNSLILDSVDRDTQIDFCMCNPPFYGSSDEISELRDNKALPPFAVCEGQPHEMITPGGEALFVIQMITESLRWTTRIKNLDDMSWVDGPVVRRTMRKAIRYPNLWYHMWPKRPYESALTILDGILAPLRTEGLVRMEILWRAPLQTSSEEVLDLPETESEVNEGLLYRLSFAEAFWSRRARRSRQFAQSPSNNTPPTHHHHPQATTQSLPKATSMSQMAILVTPYQPEPSRTHCPNSPLDEEGEPTVTTTATWVHQMGVQITFIFVYGLDYSLFESLYNHVSRKMTELP